jgi:hypothetical protein
VDGVWSWRTFWGEAKYMEVAKHEGCILKKEKGRKLEYSLKMPSLLGGKIMRIWKILKRKSGRMG